jgi:hypothetical protein
MEHDFENGYNRMEVRNARLGMRGWVSPQAYYRMQVDWSVEGRFVPLDFFAGYELKDFSLTVGQQTYYLSTEFKKNPAEIYFLSTSLLSRYISTYPIENRELGAIGSRDIGALFSYSLKKFTPVTFRAGVFNGEGINTNQWSNSVNYLLRIDAGLETGAQAAISCYGGRTPVGDNMLMANAELRYISKNFGVECEYAQRYVTDSITKKLSASFIQGYYVHDFTPGKYIHYVKPTLRYDFGSNLNFATSYGIEYADIQRVTVGLNFGVVKKKNVLGELRLNSEFYLINNKPSSYADNAQLHNKLMVGIAVGF